MGAARCLKIGDKGRNSAVPEEGSDASLPVLTMKSESRPTRAMSVRMKFGIPPNVVMKWTGHNDDKAMKPYIDIVDSIKASEMTKLNGRI